MTIIVCYNTNLINKEIVMEYQNIHIRMDKDLHDRLKELAGDERRSISAALHILLEEALEARNERA
jgi:hypothetical protein